MPELLKQMLARSGYMNPEPGAEGGGNADATPIESTPELLEEHGMTADEWKALPAHEQAMLAADTSASDDLTFEEMTERSNTPAPTAAPAPPAPAPSPAPTPAPTAAPAATPAPTAAPAPGAPAPAPAAETPAPPPPAPEPRQWHAVVDESMVLQLPEVALPPVPQPKLTDAMKAEKETAKKALTALEDKFAEGEITAEEYRNQRAPHEEVVERVNGRAAADMARSEGYKDAVNAAFDSAVQASLAQAKAAGLDYLAPENKDKLAELDRRVVAFANAAAQMFPDKPGPWIDRWALDRAHQELAAKNGIKLGTAAPAPAPGAPAPAAKPPAARAAADLSQLPPTLRGAPPAADPAIAGGEFAHLANLSGRDLELATARFTPEQMDRWLDR